MKEKQVYAKNKKALHRYKILEKFEAGIKLEGHEVKSIRAGQASLKGTYVTFHKGDAYMTNLTIPKYKYSQDILDYDPERKRKLLLKQKEIDYLSSKSKEKGLTIVPLALYNSGRYVKVQIAVAKGKKKKDKRAELKQKQQEREANRMAKKMSTEY